MKKNKKGFTLIELLAVIVILGLLMAIAIPSVTRYITQSRKKTLTSTIGNYINALVNEVNDLSYTFTGTNTIYAVPIECISLERGGTNPFGEWHQANNAYWAYVLVQYDDLNSSYRYGYTFKDSAGYGLYPTTQAKLNESGKQILTGLELSRPTTGKVTNIASIDKWSGFDVDASTDLVVLEATREGEVGDGKTTCTLCQKGDNYAQVEEEKAKRPRGYLVDLIKQDNTLITASPTLTTSSNNTTDASGLYSSTDTNSGDATYYFRGDVANNYVKFADQIWRVIRINEDGTIRLILNEKIGEWYQFNTSESSYSNVYYSNSDTAKPTLNSWYITNITNKGYDSYVATTLFCEQAKVTRTSNTCGNVTMVAHTEYTPNFKCSTDGNGKGILNSKVGLITYDEVIHAGGYYNEPNSKYYLYNENYGMYTMSPHGYVSNYGYSNVWGTYYNGMLDNRSVSVKAGNGSILRPVISLNADVLATGTGTSSDSYVIQTN